ncbi:anti-repressor SinI family protein [Bacillus sp. S/N-304-OC-R1]|nr:anti-repressor SinI family protein [Bacillus sp. S/N-304-OC-R1]
MDIANLDQDWLQLIIEAKNLGIPKEEVFDFLTNNIVPER